MYGMFSNKKYVGLIRDKYIGFEKCLSEQGNFYHYNVVCTYIIEIYLYVRATWDIDFIR